MNVQTTELTCLSCFAPLKEPKSVCPRCGCDNARLQNESHQIECGSILAGTYLVGKVLGQGGFGITYVGWDLNLDIKVAIKEYYPEGCVTRDTHTHVTVLTYAGAKEAFFQKGKERFVEEARALARLTGDSGVVGVRSFFYENGTAYIVMDYVEGETLKSYAAHRGGKLPSAEVLALFRPLVRSLARVHDNGLLHRDISPDNIMLRPDGTLALLDFGAARQMSVTGERSNTINVKHGYAPEEQYRTRGEQGPWTDVYALCATIYRLTAGVTPPEALDRMANDEPLTPPNDLGADFTPSQQQALLRGLALRANARTRDLRILASELYDGAAPAQAPQTAIVPPSATPIAPVASAPTEFVTQPVSQKAKPEAKEPPSAPRKRKAAPPSEFVTQPVSQIVQPEAKEPPSAPKKRKAAPPSEFVTQPVSQKAQPTPKTPKASVPKTEFVAAQPKDAAKPAAAENSDALNASSAEPQKVADGASVSQEAPSTADAKRKKILLIRCYAAYAVFAVFLLSILIALSQGVGGVALYPILSAVGIVLLGFLFKKSNAKYLGRTNRISSVIILSINLLVTVAFAVIIGAMYLPYACAVPADSSYASPTQAPAAAATPDTGLSSDTVINFQDPIIEKGVRNVLGKTNGETITVGDVAYITNLCIAGDSFVVNNDNFWPYVDYYSQQYSVDDGQTYTAFPGYTISLSDLAYFKGLQRLDIAAVNVLDLDKLKSCANLTDIFLDACGNVDLSVFEGIDGLTTVSISDCDSVVMSGSAENLKFTSFGLINCGQFSTNMLIGMKSVIYLTLLDCSGFSDLSFLKQMTQLTSLNVSGTEITDITPIAALTDLQSLMLQNVSTADISSLRTLTKLESIMFGNVPVSDIQILSNMRSLTGFQCFGTNITDFSPLQGLPIQWIYVDSKDESTLKQMFPNAEVYGF